VDGRLVSCAAARDGTDLSPHRWDFAPKVRFALDSPLEGNGFELPVPREIGSGFEASAELGPIDRRRGGIIRAVVGLGKPIELLRRLEGSSFTAA
jgi:hypothetical protein